MFASLGKSDSKDSRVSHTSANQVFSLKNLPHASKLRAAA